MLAITNAVKGDYKEITSSSDKAFLLDLFARHQNAATKLGDAEDVQVFYGRSAKYKGKTNCFYLEHSSGSKVDISYLKCIAGLRDELNASKYSLLQQHFEKVGLGLANFVAKVLQELALSKPQVVKALADKFPYKKAKAEQQYLYFKLMVEIASKCENVEEEVVSVCVEKFFQIDAEIESSVHCAIINDTDALTEKIRVPLF